VWDDDGEFLLIEAAYALPPWLKPETASNRVWLRSGGLHIVPLPTAALPQLPPAPTLQQALQVGSSGAVPLHLWRHCRRLPAVADANPWSRLLPHTSLL
jgi:SGT1 protein